MGSDIRMEHVAKGPRPRFSDNPDADRLMAMVLALASEVSVLREELDAMAALAAARGVFSESEFRGFRPDAERAAAREQWRADFIQRVLYVFEAEARGDR